MKAYKLTIHSSVGQTKFNWTVLAENEKDIKDFHKARNQNVVSIKEIQLDKNIKIINILKRVGEDVKVESKYVSKVINENENTR